MPIFEYYSPQTHKIYSFFARGPGMGDQMPRCPDDPSASMQKLVSSFAVTRRSAGGAEGDSAEGMDDSRMESMMAEIEKEMAGMNEENPDPRQMARMMRQMAKMSGETLPESMEEMIRRLEAGEDPEKLEEAFGDLDELAEVEAEGTDVAGNASSGRRFFSRRQQAPDRDPVLYELSEYVKPEREGL